LCLAAEQQDQRPAVMRQRKTSHRHIHDMKNQRNDEKTAPENKKEEK
jgi:hypothetical protein